jgi:hypothetical protein
MIVPPNAKAEQAQAPQAIRSFEIIRLIEIPKYHNHGLEIA